MIWVDLLSSQPRSLALIFLAASVCSPWSIEAQPAIIRSAATTPCRGCTLTIDSIVTLGRSERPGEFFPRAAFSPVVVNGRILIASTAPVQMFGLNGRFIGLLGREGQGPGEFPTWLTSLALGPARRVYGFAGQNVVVFDSTFAHERDVTLERATQVPTVLTDGRFAGLARLPVSLPNPPSTGDFARSFHSPLFYLFSASGNQVRAVGTTLTGADQIIVAGEGGTVWTAKRAPYEMKQWSQDGVLLRTIERITPWFDRSPYDPVTPGPGGRPRSDLRRIFQDSAGRLWASISIAKSNWSETMRDRGGACCDSLIEVLDPLTGELLASARVPLFVNRIVEGYVTATASGANGEPLLVVYRASLATPGR